jgi:hypothetical protein
MPKFSPDSLKMSKAGKGRQRQILMDKQVWRVHVATSAPDVVLASLLALLEETETDDLAAVTDAWLRRTYGTGTA